MLTFQHYKFLHLYLHDMYQVDYLFEDGAKVNISHNYVRGISNYGNLYLGNQTIITSNGGYQIN